MDLLTIIAVFLILYGLACFYVALAKPEAIWRLGKLQGFVQLLSEKGTVIMLLVLGAAALVGGLAILLI